VDRIDRDETPAEELWTPYPMQKEPRRSNMSLYFDESCKLSFIARDASGEMPRAPQGVKLKEEMYDRLQKWERELSRIFESGLRPAPYIFILRFVMTLSFARSLICGLTGNLPTGCAITH